MSEGGLVAVGDSLVNAGKSWAWWLHRTTEMPLRRVSVGGATSYDVLDQLPALEDHHYDVACLTVGTNDVLFDWSPDWFAENLRRIVTGLSEVADRTVIPTLSLGLHHFPGSGFVVRARVEAANEIIRGCGALVVNGSQLRWPRMLGPDRVHPTVLGQATLADRAAEALGLQVQPSTLLTEQERRPQIGAFQTAERTAKGLVKRAIGRVP